MLEALTDNVQTATIQRQKWLFLFDRASRIIEHTGDKTESNCRFISFDVTSFKVIAYLGKSSYGKQN